MADYQITDYSIFNDAVASTKKYTESVTAVHDTSTECKTILSNEAVFMGPVADNCAQEFASLDSSLSSIVSNMGTLAGYITSTDQNYQAGDKKAEDTVLTETESGTNALKDNSKSGVVSYKVGTLSEPGKEKAVLGKRATLLDVTVDGNSLGQDGSIVIKKGQTVHLKVKVPDEIENVQTIKRTSADGAGGWSKWVSQKNTPNVDRNDPSTFVNQREYDWYITGNNNTDNITLSQTVFFSIPGAKLGSYKGMVRVRVKVED